MEDLIVQIAAVAITGLIGIATAMFTRKTGIEIEAKLQNDLHSAVITSLTNAIEDGVPAERDRLRRIVVEYIKNGGAREAFNKLPVTELVIDQLIGRYLPGILSAAPPRNAYTMPIQEGLPAHDERWSR